jgi:peptidoglycan hydrolase CwlO-like protein
MAGKRIPQNNEPVVSPTDFQERTAKRNAQEAQRVRLLNLQMRVKELEAAEQLYTAKIQSLEAEVKALGSQLSELQQENISMKKKAKTTGTDIEPLDDPIGEEDLKLKKEPAKARQLPRTKKTDEEEDKEDKNDKDE